MKNVIFDGDIIEKAGHAFRVSITPDYDCGLPWEDMNGLGVIRKTSKRHVDGYSDKSPGERPMNNPDRNEYQFFYDIPETLKKARLEGWGLSPEHVDELSKRLKRQPTKREIIREAVERDFKFCSGFINDEWQYYNVSVYPDGEENDYQYCLGGVDDYVDSYPGEVAEELVDNALHDIKQAEKQAKIKSRFYDAMQCGL